MGILIKIEKSKHSNILNIELRDILKIIKSGSKLEWVLWDDVELVYKKTWRLNVSELENKVRNQENGFPIEWNDLLDFSKHIHQAIWITILGSIKPLKLSKGTSVEDVYKNCEYVIKLIDSSFWEIYINNNEVAKEFLNTFHNTTILKEF